MPQDRSRGRTRVRGDVVAGAVYVQLYAEASREVADAIDAMVEASLAKGER